MLISVEEEVISHISFIAFIHYFSYLPSERGVGQSLLELLYQNPNENCSLVPGDAATLAPLAIPFMHHALPLPVNPKRGARVPGPGAQKNLPPFPTPGPINI